MLRWSHKIGDKLASPRAPAEGYFHTITILVLTDGPGLPTKKTPAANNSTLPTNFQVFQWEKQTKTEQHPPSHPQPRRGRASSGFPWLSTLTSARATPRWFRPGSLVIWTQHHNSSSIAFWDPSQEPCVASSLTCHLVRKTTSALLPTGKGEMTQRASREEVIKKQLFINCIFSIFGQQ